MSDESIPININLEGSLAAKFNEIKAWSELKQNTEVIRFCINETHRRCIKPQRRQHQ